MKKTLILNVFALMSLFSYSQEKIIVYDFNDPKPLADEKLPHGTLLKVQINNVNRSLYKIETSVEQEDHNNEKPEIFKTFALPAFLNFSLPEVPKEINTKRSPTATLTIPDEIAQELKTIQLNYGKLQAVVILNNDMKALFNNCENTYDDIEQRLLDLVNNLITGSTSGAGVFTKDKRANQIEKLISTTDSYITTSKNSKDKLIQLISEYKEVNKTLVRDWQVTISNWEKAGLKPGDKGFDETKYLRYLAAKNKLEDYTIYVASITTELDKTNKLVEELEKFRTENKFNDLRSNYWLINKSNFTYISEVTEIEADEVNLKIKITSDKPLPCNKPLETVINNNYQTVGGLKVDFSTGIFCNFKGTKDFLGSEYYYKPINDSIVTIQEKDGGSRALMSVGALVHFYKRGEKVNWAFSTGLSTTTSFDGLNYHFGVSGILGHKNRLVLSTGLTLREVKILDRNYTVNTEYKMKDLPEEVSTIKIFPQAGFFVGISYNFSPYKSE